jgi:flavin-binding protein dodecin
MSVAKVIELSSSSTKSFEDAIERGISRASKTLKNVRSAWIKEQQVDIDGGRISGYRVNMMLTFVLDGSVDDE